MVSRVLNMRSALCRVFQSGAMSVRMLPWKGAADVDYVCALVCLCFTVSRSLSFTVFI